MSQKPAIRCAVYTRKSSDEGLDQEFNSLDAQFEACAAYIASQRHEGWRLLPRRYDDGGLSGGTLERPALQRLLVEIEAGRIGMVVVYKIDRLTRSLSDFARLVDRLETAGCSFVSVTQAFNTSSSMGRLTLNVLLSFAQFEREVTAERIRDKIAASKKKGLWMGGNVPLGYDPHPDPLRRELAVNPEEAETVRTLFQLYGDHGSLRAVEAEAKALGLTSKARAGKQGSAGMGRPLSRGQLHYLLSNPVYRGMIRHKSTLYPGQHPAIVEEELWQKIQVKLQAASRRKRGPCPHPDAPAGLGPAPSRSAWLTGLIRDETGDRLTPTHTLRRGRRFGYYVSNRLISNGPDPAGWRLPARTLEQAVLDAITTHLEAATAGHTILAVPEAATASEMAARVKALAAELKDSGAAALPEFLESAILMPTELRISLSAGALGDRLTTAPDTLAPSLLGFRAETRIRRRGVETRIATGPRAPAPDRTLVRVLVEAHVWTKRLREGAQLAQIARDSGHSESYIRTRAPLAFLAPAIQKSILEGAQPPDLSVERIVRGGIPLNWVEQECRFGFTSCGTDAP